MKTSLLIGLSVITLALFGCSEKNAGEESLHFLIVGHVADSTAGVYPPFAAVFPKTFGDTTLDFAVFTGNIVPHSDASAWNIVDAFLKPCPYDIFFAPGEKDLTNRTLYTQRYGSPDKYFERSGALFVIWDVTENGWNVSTEQKNLLLQKLSEKHFNQLFIFTSQVIWYDPIRTPQIIPNSLEGKTENLSFYSGLLQELNDLKIPVYLFAGDVGAKAVGSELTTHRFGNVRMIASGMGGGAWDNYMDVHIDKGSARVEVRYVADRPPLNLDNISIPVAP